MNLPFTTAQFFHVIERYNHFVFPFQLVILLSGFLAIWLLYTKTSNRNRWISTILSIVWLWNGIAYHIAFFTAINPAAYGFGALFILQGLLLFYSSFTNKHFNYITNSGWRIYAGYFFIVYGLILYPVISYFVEKSFSQTIILGLPCPSTIMTFGFFILAAKTLAKYLLIIPVIWSIIGISAAINIGVVQDFMIFIAAIAACIAVIGNKLKM